jgi:hypothetical protein
MRPTSRSIVLASSLALLLTACPKDKASDSPMTQAEAHDALEESTASSQASALTTSSVEISTSFTIGKSVEEAAAEVRTFIGTQLPCADVTLAAATLTVKYGAKGGNCVFKGHTFSGTHVITVSKNDDAQVLVDHTWTDLSNGVVKVSGTAHVTWDLDDQYRRVQHDLTWTRISDGRTGHGTGDRTQKPLAGGLAEGIQVDGSRTWTGPAGRWDLAIEGVQMRWADPVPQAGTYRLASPKGRSLQLSFRRVDADTIAVTLASGGRSFELTVNSKGGVADKS